MKLLLSIILLVAFVLGCSEKKLKITKVGEFSFRRSYAGLQFWEDTDPRKVDSIISSNPAIQRDSFNIKEVELLADLSLSEILDLANNLKRDKFPDNPKKVFNLIHENGNQLQGKFSVQSQSGKQNDRYLLEISNEKSKAIFNLQESYGALNRDISYLIVDLIPGGYPEIVVLNEYYIMNGDNSDIYIYEVTE